MVLVAALAALAWGADVSATACKAGARTVGGVRYVTFCGPAKAQVSIRAVNYRFDNGGACARTGRTFSIDVGTLTAGTARPKYAYFGLAVVNAHAGVNRSQIVAWDLPRRRAAVVGAAVTLAPGLRSGSFTGKLAGTNEVVTGGFVCSGSL
jgi:hypothetical protein